MRRRILTVVALGAAKFALLLLAGSVAAAEHETPNRRVSPDLFGELVDVVAPGTAHWSKASGDDADPLADARDLDNNFGQHAGAVTRPVFSSRATAYAEGSVAEEAVYAYGDQFVIDRALGAPYGTPQNAFSKSVQAHSCVVVDGEGQMAYSPTVYHNRTAGYVRHRVHTASVDYVRIDSSIAYRKNPQLKQTRHAIRHVVFVRRPGNRAYLVLVDDLDLDESTHRYEWLLQTDTKHAVTSPGAGRHVISQLADLHVVTVEPQSITAQVSDHHDIWRTLGVVPK